MPWIAKVNHDISPKNTTYSGRSKVVNSESNEVQTHHGRVIAQFRKARNWSQEDLAQALRTTARTVQRIEKQEMIKSISRRKVLATLLSIPLTLLGIKAIEEESNDTSLLSIERYDRSQMAFLKEELATRWEMYHTGGTIRAGRGLSLWIGEIIKFAKSCEGTIWYRDALVLLSMSFQLDSCVQRDLMDYPKAHAAFKKAYRIAKELGDAELMAAAMTREGITFIQEDRPIEAIQHLKGALDLILRQGLPILRAYSLQALSEAYAKAQMTQDSWHAIELAERIITRGVSGEETSQTRLSSASITVQKGINAVTLKDYERAITLLDRGLLTYDPAMIRGRARLMAQKAEAYRGLGLIDVCVTTAEESIVLARSVGSAKTIARIQTLHTALIDSPYRKEPSIARLGTMLPS
jgi:transcriptional regulator with XRE-family HTH domain